MLNILLLWFWLYYWACHVQYYLSSIGIGCDIVFFPGAYDHGSCASEWELLHRARAIDNQFYVAAISGARNTKVNYVLHAHSMFVDPVGDIVAQAGIDEEILFYEIGTCDANDLTFTLEWDWYNSHYAHSFGRFGCGGGLAREGTINQATT